MHTIVLSASKPLGNALVSAHILYQYVHHVILLSKGTSLSHQSPQAGTCPRWKWVMLGAVELCEYMPSCCRVVSLPRRISSILYKVLVNTDFRT